MLSNVSFGSTFKVNNKDNSFHKFSQFENLVSDITLNPQVRVKFADKFINENSYFGKFDYNANYTVLVPDNMDDFIETYCANRGIKYSKYGTQELMNEESIMSRIKHANFGYKNALVDIDKLNKLLTNQDSNFKHCEHDYDKYYQNKTDFILKNGESFSAPTLSIRSAYDKDELLDYIKRYGVNNLQKDSLYIDLIQKTIEPEHCLYFAMRDAGLKQIPVYVDNDTYDIGCALGVIN